VPSEITLSKTIFFLCLSFVAGIFFAPSGLLLGVLLILSSFFFLKSRMVILLCLLFFLFGAFCFSFALLGIPRDLHSPVYGKVVEEPLPAGDSRSFVLEHNKGRVLIYTDRYAQYRYGDLLRVEGSFERPSPEGYANYLKKDGVYHTSFFPEIEKEEEGGSRLKRGIFSFREYLRGNIRESVPAPHRFLLEAMLLGDRSSFSDELDEKLSVSGTRHITAVSGMHVAILSFVIFYLFSFFGIKKKRSAVYSIFLIALFVVFVGAPSSAVRAGIMGGLALFSGIASRKLSLPRTMSFAAAGMLAFNPLLLHHDLGFQLSFLALMGIFAFHRPITKIFLKRKNGDDLLPTREQTYKKEDPLFSKEKLRELVANLLGVTVGAQLFVLPLVLYNFGYVPLLSVPANILIAPLLPLVMIFGFLTALTGLFTFSFFSYVLLSYVLGIIGAASSLPFSAAHIENTPSSFIVLLYALIFSAALFIHARNNKRSPEENLF